MAKYVCEMRDEQCIDTVTLDVPDGGDVEVAAVEAVEEWLLAGNWPACGCEVSACYTVRDEDGDEVDSGGVSVDIEPDHPALIREATRRERDRSCGDDPDDHNWTSEGEGGCDENPGVWSTGGTSMLFASRCRDCGLRRLDRYAGSQRNPGECDTVSYEMPDLWCEECECECECEE